MKAENTKLQTELDELEQHVHEQPNPDLLNVLPVGTCDLADLPEAITRRLFEALRLEVHYDKQSNTAVCRITLTGETIPAVQQAANDGVVVPLRPHSTSPHQPQRKIHSSPSAATPLFPSVTCPGRTRTCAHPGALAGFSIDCCAGQKSLGERVTR